MTTLNTIVSISIVLILALAVWAKIRKQTIIELIGDLRDLVQDKKEDVVEETTSGFGYYR